MAITGLQLSQLTARTGIARCGAFRCGAVLENMKSDGSYLWTKDYTIPSSAAWTLVREPKRP